MANVCNLQSHAQRQKLKLVIKGFEMITRGCCRCMMLGPDGSFSSWVITTFALKSPRIEKWWLMSKLELAQDVHPLLAHHLEAAVDALVLEHHLPVELAGDGAVHPHLEVVVR
eukprot:CAMPEP_0177584040 /NCGR_PEP_ID=MMETSP0419_2-20121207/3670_1 /TAXON_ID=582737 /ORGANISM="Tetraselmis sp., Strain GSL018" /LENGTH=112 /DNA_ID=CAMNT_0019073525 /DNA_START=365 /DNA_END=700 /DNA_ORIENTATION=-